MTFLDSDDDIAVRARAVFWSMSFHSLPLTGYCSIVGGKLGQHKSILHVSLFQENQIQYGTGMSNKTFKRENIWFNDNITTTNATPLEIKEDKVYTHRLWYIINIKIIVSIRSSNKISLIWLHTFTIYGLIIDPHDVQLLVGLIAQMLEHCAGIPEVRVGVPFQAWISLLFK